MRDMALYIKNLEIFFSLYIPSLTDRERAILKDSIIELYNLTDEEEFFASKKRGNALLMIGFKMLHAVFKIPEYKFDYMGKAGGR